MAAWRLSQPPESRPAFVFTMTREPVPAVSGVLIFLRMVVDHESCFADADCCDGSRRLW